MTNTNLFHVHTFRCGHAENVPDTAYIERAIELGASDIWFSDHAPFPGDPFRNRMKFDDLHEYLDTLLSRSTNTRFLVVRLFPEYNPDISIL